MQLKTLVMNYQNRISNPNTLTRFTKYSPFFSNFQLPSHNFCRSSSLALQYSPRLLRFSEKFRNRNRFQMMHSSSKLISGENIDGNCEVASNYKDNDDSTMTMQGLDSSLEVVEVVNLEEEEELESQSIWKQIKEIVMFSGPATGLWICGPLMSLISTAIIGQGSSTELAALEIKKGKMSLDPQGPGTVFCDNMNLLFMFLSIATSNMVASSLAKQDKKEVQHQISILLFVGLTSGILMLLFSQFLGSWALTGFVGPKNLHIVPAASKYVQIRGLAWPAILFGLIAQSASLGMKDSLGPLKSLVVASVVNGIGHLVLCNCLHYGIVGAAWATMASQVVAAYMMVAALNKKGYSAFKISVPSPNEFLCIFSIAAPVFVTLFSKMAFYSLVTYFATAMGTNIVAAHQVMMQMYGMCVVWGEPLSQTAQSFMPELLYGVKQRLDKAQALLKSLLIIGCILGLAIATMGMSVPWLFPNLFTTDLKVIEQMHQVLIMFFLALSVTPCTHSLEGTLLAGRDFRFISLSMSGCFSLGAILLWLVNSRGYGLPGCWFALLGFQWARLFLAFQRLFSNGMLYTKDLNRYDQLGKLKAS